jgi:hypothetical protein
MLRRVALKNRRLGGTCRLHHQDDKNRWATRATSRKTAFFIVTAVETSNLTESTQCHSADGRIRSVEKYNDLVGNGTRNFPAEVYAFKLWETYAWYIAGREAKQKFDIAIPRTLLISAAPKQSFPSIRDRILHRVWSKYRKERILTSGAVRSERWIMERQFAFFTFH